MRSFLKDVNPDGVDFVGAAANLRTFALLKAQWTAAFIDNLPDSSFAIIEPGGEKDAGGKTTPRSKRHLPYKDASGKIDLPHLRNALARLDQTQVPDAAKAAARTKLEAAAKAAGVGGGSDTSKARNGNMTKLPKSEFVKRLAAQGIELALEDPKVEDLAKSLNVELTDATAEDDDEPQPEPTEKSVAAKVLAAFAKALGLAPDDAGSPIDKSKLDPVAREYVGGLEKRLAAIEKANTDAARVALQKRVTALVDAGWVEADDADAITEPEVGAIEKARDRVVERLKKAGVFSSFGTPKKEEDTPGSLRELVQKAVREQLGREPKDKIEEARVKQEIYKANPGLRMAVLNEERSEKQTRTA